ncbi:MAG: CBS domain-containing protein [Planctomycetes bacterium]|nr:CBS domain-containing protein [Planctomycetota bacterium]
MTSVLVVVDARASLEEAARLMRGHEIRHLPVLHGGELVGILSQRDIYLVETLSDARASEIRVEEAMTSELFLVDPEESVYSVASRMAARRIGSAVVARGAQLLGLFTATDALRALAVYAHANPRGVGLPEAEGGAWT